MAASGPPALAMSFQFGVQEHIDAAQKEAGHRGHPLHRLPLGQALFQAGEISLGHLLVAGQAEQQGDVDVDPFADEAGNGGQALQGGGDLDEDIGPVHLLPELAGLGDGALGVPGQVRVDLQADEAVPAVQPL